MAALSVPPATHPLAILLAGAGLAAAALRAFAWPWLPKAVPVAIIAAALGLVAIGIVRRVRWQLTRRRG